MKTLFETFKEQMPEYSEVHRTLINNYAKIGGAEGQDRQDFGKSFATIYEIYTYCFFLGLYNDNYKEIPKGENKRGFRMKISEFGSKSRIGREDFTNLQENIFIALVVKTDIDFISLEKGEIEVKEVVKDLIKTLESYTNGGFNIIKEKQESSKNYFLKTDSFLRFINLN